MEEDTWSDTKYLVFFAVLGIFSQVVRLLTEWLIL
jgi:hypothetical protein